MGQLPTFARQRLPWHTTSGNKASRKRAILNWSATFSTGLRRQNGQGQGDRSTTFLKWQVHAVILPNCKTSTPITMPAGSFILSRHRSRTSESGHESRYGEWVKEGDFIAEIVPGRQGKAVEIYVDPVDLPLVQIGQKVMLVFDGYPVIVFLVAGHLRATAPSEER